MADWAEYYTEDGKAYYHNAGTGVTQWGRPEGFGTYGGMEKESKVVDGSNMDNMNMGNMNNMNSMSSMSDSMAENMGMQKIDLQRLPEQTLEGKLDNSPELKTSVSDGEQSGAFFFRFCYCLDLVFLRQFFNVNTEDVLRRCKFALTPYLRRPRTNLYTVLMRGENGLSGGEEEAVDENELYTNPDLYAPMWISSTLVLLIFILYNANILFQPDQDVNYIVLVRAASLIYSLLLIVPLLAKLLISLNGNQTSVAHILCLHGYSLLPLIPVVLLSMVKIPLPNSSILNALLATTLALGLIFSLWFLLNHAHIPFKPNVHYYLLLLTLFSSHLIIYLSYHFLLTK